MRELPRFGVGAAPIAQQTAKTLKYIGWAEWLNAKIAPLAKKDVRRGGLSLEDVAGRLQTAIGVYLLQGYYAIKDDKHPWETNGRNIVIWLLSAAVLAWSKSENMGVNPLLLNAFMQEKGSAAHLLKLPLPSKALDWARMDVGYLDILKRARLKLTQAEEDGARAGRKSLWASSWLDANKLARIEQDYLTDLPRDLLDKAAPLLWRLEENKPEPAKAALLKRLKTLHQATLDGNTVRLAEFRQAMQPLLDDLRGFSTAAYRTANPKPALPTDPATWTAAQKAAHLESENLAARMQHLLKYQKWGRVYEAIPGFFRRINLFNVGSTGLIIAATVYLIGVVAMRLVNKFISPLDKDFDGNRKKRPPAFPPPGAVGMGGLAPLGLPTAPLRPALSAPLLYPPRQPMMIRPPAGVAVWGQRPPLPAAQRPFGQPFVAFDGNARAPLQPGGPAR